MIDEKALEAACRAMCIDEEEANGTSGGPHPCGQWLEEGEAWWTGYRNDMIRAIAAMEEAGFVVVPVEPNNGMLGDGWMKTPCGWRGNFDDLRPVWRAMIAARPNGKS